MEKGTKRRVATVGTFDGLHRGHRRVIATLKETARKRDLEPLVVSFDRHPLETIAPERAPRLIQSPSERTNTLYNEGLQLLTISFTPQLASMTAAEWLEAMHREQRVDAMVVGYDNTFGCDGTALSIADYRRIGHDIGVEIIEAPYEPRAASSAIRRMLREGLIEEAAELLGRPFSITGTVEPGKHLGTSLGFPTANVKPDYRVQMPRRGVYEVEVLLPMESGGGVRKGVANIGTQPTVADDAPERLEVHIPGLDANLYGARLTVRFMHRIRDERKFDSLEELKAQIKEDINFLTKN